MMPPRMLRALQAPFDRASSLPSLSSLAAFALTCILASEAQAVRLGSAELFFSYDGDRSGSCVAVSEPSDIAAWSDNVLCGAFLPQGARWSHSGPLAGMRCTKIDEPADPDTWDDNFLCVPTTASVGFVWSHRGAPRLNRRTACAPWREPADPGTWNDNVLCAVPLSGFEMDLLQSIAARPAGPSRAEAELRDALEQERHRRLELERQLQQERLERQRLEAVRPDRWDRERRNVIIRRDR